MTKRLLIDQSKWGSQSPPPPRTIVIGPGLKQRDEGVGHLLLEEVSSEEDLGLVGQQGPGHHPRGPPLHLRHQQLRGRSGAIPARSFFEFPCPKSVGVELSL